MARMKLIVWFGIVRYFRQLPEWSLAGYIEVGGESGKYNGGNIKPLLADCIAGDKGRILIQEAGN